jgi:hypothetical protein
VTELLEEESVRVEEPEPDDLEAMRRRLERLAL